MRLRAGWLVPAALLAAAGAALVVATRRNLSEPHVRVFTEMVKSPAYGSQTANPVLPGGRTLQPPPAGTVARGNRPLPYGPSEKDRARAARELANPVPATFEDLARGKYVFDTFCAHCHGPKGRGDGPVAKAFPGFSFPVAAKSASDLSDGELFHVVTFGRNLMPPHKGQLVAEDRWKAIHYLRDLQRREKMRLGPLWEIPEDPRRNYLVSAAYGREVFDGNCSACHGEAGKRPRPGVPTLNVPAVLAIADDAFYWDIINHGKKGTQMPAWNKILTRTQVRSLIEYIRSWTPEGPDRAQVLARKGDAKNGRALFRGHCSGCHGRDGSGGIGISLNSPSFLALASDAFLRDTITIGRDHTAMPASYDLATQDVTDLIAYIRGWSRPRHSWEEVRRLLPKADARVGAKLYAGNCAGCHGRKGEGGIGSVLASDSFLRMADDRFLYRAIGEGRPGTAMPAWHRLEPRDVADLIAHLRGWQRSPSETLPAARRRGNAEFGRLLYEKGCVSCHGPEGRGGVGGQIGNAVFLDSASDEFLWRTIAYGKQETAMRGFLKGSASGALMEMSDEDIAHVVAYLRALGEKPRLEPLKKPFFGASARIGRELFEGKAGCAKCHGEHGEGGTGPSLANPGFLRVASNGFLAGTIVLGRDGTEMRSYTRGGNVHLSQNEVKDLVAYIRSFEERPSVPKRRLSYSASTVAEGRHLYGKFCASCHGSEGRGASGNRMDGFGPALNSPELLRSVDDGYLLATIAIGRPNTAMRPFAEGMGGLADLSGEEIRRIVAFIRSWEKGGDGEAAR